MFSSFAEQINLVLKRATKINDMKIYELSNSYPRPETRKIIAQTLILNLMMRENPMGHWKMTF